MHIAASNAESQVDLPAGSYIYCIVPSSSSSIAAISSDDSLRLIDSTRLHGLGKGVFHDIHRGVTCLQTIKDRPNVFLTSGRDAAVRGWDTDSGGKVVEWCQRTVAEFLRCSALGSDPLL